MSAVPAGRTSDDHTTAVSGSRGDDQVVRQIRRHGRESDPGSAWEASAFTGDELAEQRAPARLWHVPNLIPGNAVTLFQGDGAAGKSILFLQLAVSTALGRPWLGNTVRKGNVLYLSAEDERDEVHRRLEVITDQHGVRMSDLGGLKVLDRSGKDAVLAGPDRLGRLVPTDNWSEFERIVGGWEPTLIGIDNLADVFAGEENSRTHARQFIGMLHSCAKQNGRSVVLIGHPSLAGMASGTGASGSTGWNNSVRSRLYLSIPPDDPEGRLLTLKKANYGPANLEIHLTWRGGTFDRDDHGAVGGLRRRSDEHEVDTLFMNLLDAFAAQGRFVTSTPGHGYAPAEFAREPAASRVTKKGFDASMRRLFTTGQIVVEEFGPPSKRRHRIVRGAAG